MDVNVDSTINFDNPQGRCPLPEELEIFPSGEAVIYSYNGRDVIFAEINREVTLCFGVVPEVLSLKITGGRGRFLNASGTIEMTFTDDVILNEDPISTAPRVVFANDASFVMDVEF